MSGLKPIRVWVRVRVRVRVRAKLGLELGLGVWIITVKQTVKIVNSR